MRKKAFTLVEMLIVIVIIGILAAALIPRLTSAQAKARNTARKADVNQISVGLMMYKELEGNFPTDLGQVVSAGYMKLIPRDPKITSVDPCDGAFSSAGAIWQSSGFYFYGGTSFGRIGYNGYLYEYNNTHPPYFARLSARMEQDGSKNSHSNGSYDCTWISNNRGADMVNHPDLPDLYRARIAGGLTTQARFFMSLIE